MSLVALGASYARALAAQPFLTKYSTTFCICCASVRLSQQLSGPWPPISFLPLLRALWFSIDTARRRVFSRHRPLQPQTDAVLRCPGAARLEQRPLGAERPPPVQRAAHPPSSCRRSERRRTATTGTCCWPGSGSALPPAWFSTRSSGGRSVRPPHPPLLCPLPCL